MYLSQRKRREYLTVVIMVQLTYEGSIDTDEETAIKARTIISNSLSELEVNDIKQRASDYRAAFRLAKKTMVEWDNLHKGDLAGEKVIITTYCFLELLNNLGIVSFAEGSQLASLMDWMLSYIDVEDCVTKKRIASGKKTALHFLEKLQKEGYFL